MIESERLCYDRFHERDRDALLALFRDEDIRRYLLDDQLVGAEWLTSEIEASEARFTEGSLGLWSVRLDPSGPVVGFTGFRPFFEPPALQLLYGFLRTVWGRGLATEAAGAACRTALDHMGFDRVQAAVDVPNRASVRVLERLGFSEVRRTEDGAEGTSFHELDRATLSDGAGGESG